VLPADIRVIDVSKAAIGFDACSSAVGKHYRYVIWNSMILPADRDGRVWHVKRQLDAGAMTASCALFEGEHDFSSFVTRPNFKQKSTVRTVFKVAMSVEKPLLYVDIWADGFLYKMVRNIVRALVKAGEGRYSRDDIRSILEAKDRASSPGTAPASGLYLERVFYSQGELREDLGRDFSL
jgi:tRNA pseudouridine38-40 synthase